ncbi:MAG: FAD-dependent oxidoreductase [Rhodothermaceae bacterium]|nr:FAD-dependent oxidoreductase [Rhodothermaceae bacterium]
MPHYVPDALPQYIAGFYQWQQTSVNLEKLCGRYGTGFINARVISVNPAGKSIELSSGEVLHYDILIINVGSRTPAISHLPNVYPVKPMSRLLSLRSKLDDGTTGRLLIAGAGAAGTEFALNLSHPARKNRPHITLLEQGERILSAFPVRAAETAERVLNDRGVKIAVNTAFDEQLAANFDAVILATGNEPVSLTIDHPFKTGRGGRILTGKSLLIPGQDAVFAAGDTADISGMNLPPVGVHAVKQGKLLRENIAAWLDGTELKSYKPWPLTPLIISNGPDHAILTVGNFSLSGKSQALLKYMLDMHWMEKYTLPPSRRRSKFQLLRDARGRA